MAEIDRCAIETHGIGGLFLMEQAGNGIAGEMLASLPSGLLRRVAVLCGKGNNGGDGLVVARCLARRGCRPLVGLIGREADLKGDAFLQHRRLREEGIPVHECADTEALRAFFVSAGDSRVWVDALLGTGARGAPTELAAEAIAGLNRRAGDTVIVSVDIPSGVDAGSGRVEGEAVRADIVYTLGLPKTGHVLPPGLNHYRKLAVLDIGFPRALLENADAEAVMLSPRDVHRWIAPRNPSVHKGSQGHLLVVAGSRGMTGAALLCARAAVWMGAGLVTAACPDSLLPIYAGGVWEMLTLPVAETPGGGIAREAFDRLFGEEARYKAVVVGPGLGRDPSTQELVRRMVRDVEAPLVLDGDALAAVTPGMLDERRFPWVATPHPGEMARLFQTTPERVQADRFGFARRLAGNGAGVAVLKGAKTVIAQAGRPLWVNPTGNPAMASGGMGDVLAGVIGALLVQGIPPLAAAASGVYLHGLAADLWVDETGAETAAAGQVLNRLQGTLRWVRDESGPAGSSPWKPGLRRD